jgi:imidazolonepropionase-like amidohydrolase
VDECIKATRYTLGHGADFIKIWPRRGSMFNPDELKAIVQTAAQVGKFVTVHCEDSRDARSAILAGAKTIDHAYGIEDEVVEMGNKAGVIYVSTLIEAWATILHGAEAGMPLHEIEWSRRGFDLMCQAYKRIRKLGGIMAIGTDSGAKTLVQMFSSSAVELELLVKHCDFTPMEAIVAATKNGALASFIGDKTGTIEPGKFADIIVVDGDPLADIKILQDTKKIKMVMLEGKVEIEQ